jgi:hypothetical protein
VALVAFMSTALIRLSSLVRSKCPIHACLAEVRLTHDLWHCLGSLPQLPNAGLYQGLGEACDIPGTIGWSAFTIRTRALMDSMKLTHLYEKFMVAVDLLATSPGSLQRRLEGAYRNLIDVEPRDFDDREMRTTFKQILSRITIIQDGQVGSIAAACSQMSD